MARTKHDLRSAATRRQLITAARKLFGSRGYAAVGTEEIVRAAGVTRGALYHQFRDKADLFAAVAEEIEAEIAQRVAAAAGQAADPVAALRAGARLFLDVCAEPEVERIILLDAPAVLGWEAWRDLAARYGLGLVQLALQAAIDAGTIAPQPVEPLAHVLIGALDECALYVARAGEPATARAECAAIFDQILHGLAPGR
ncbi:MAG TPA: helix-turn-helix domain-containing protein [Streptosporangiaceae bacterium]|jgi:AcrR family transcriptional regulator|nr:helix-turn-helix domain-containing protein [Streptosporangiaceae bacterium]